MIERIRRLVKDLCEFGTCQTLAAPDGERSIAPDARGASAKDCLSLAPGVTKMKRTALTVHDPRISRLTSTQGEDGLR
jgi:hypothetical protein